MGKTHGRHLRHVSIREPLIQKDVSEAWRATQVASNHKTRASSLPNRLSTICLHGAVAQQVG